MAVSQTSCEPMFINGEWTEGSSGKRIPVYDPSTEEVIAEIPDASAADVDAAVAAARYAFDEGGWPQTTAQDRGRILFRIAAKLREEAAQLAELESRNCGKPIVEAEYDIADAATCFEYYGGLATKVSGLVNPVPDNALSLSLKEPVGVAGQIIPWNYPLGMAAWKLAPALAAGCTCVLKPAEQTPLTMLKLAGWLAEAGVPAGVVNVVTGLGETAGAAIVAHPGVDKVAFTGSAAVGKLIMKSAADTLKRVTLELGGKSPNIFFADADFEAGHRRRALRHFHQPGRGLLGRQPGAGAAFHLFQISRGHDREGAHHQAGAAARPLHQDGSAGQPRTVRPRLCLSADRQVGSQAGARRRPPCFT